MSGVRRILVVQTGFLGDVVLTTPLLRELARRDPAARLTVVATGAGAAILSGVPEVHEILVLDKRRGPGRPLRTALLVRRLRRRRFDLALAAHRSHRSAILVRASGARRRIGFEGAAGRWAYGERVTWDPAAHATSRYLALTALLAPCPGRVDPRPRVEVSPGARRRADATLRAAGLPTEAPSIVLAPGSTWGTKRWPARAFAELADALAGDGLRVVLVGSRAERALCASVASACRTPAIDLAGRTSPEELAAVLLRARTVVANDNGAGHLAAAVGAPVISIFGPTVPAMGYAPMPARGRVVEHEGLACRPCHRHGPPTCPLGHFRCMREIPAARVLEAVRALAGTRTARRATDQPPVSGTLPG